MGGGGGGGKTTGNLENSGHDEKGGKVELCLLPSPFPASPTRFLKLSLPASTRLISLSPGFARFSSREASVEKRGGFAIECLKTKIKAVTLANHNKGK